MRFRILREYTETPAWNINGHYTRVDLPVGTICEGDEFNEEGFGPGYIVSCSVNDKVYNGIKLYTEDENRIWERVLSGGKRKRKSTKKVRKSKKRATRRR